MRVGIYGDSFVKSGMDWYSWPTFLKKQYNVTVDASPGVSIEYILKKFNQTHENFDKVIVVLTEPSRVFLSNHPHFKHMYLNETFIKNVTKDIPKIEQKEILEYFHFHVKYVHDNESCKLKYLAFKEYILKKRPDCLILPAFDLGTDSIMPLVYISSIDFKHPVYGKQIEEESLTNGDPRPCHINVTNNCILAGRIKKWIKLGKFNHTIGHYKTVDSYEDLFKLPL